MALNEADTRVKLIDPALHGRGWTEDLIRREETAGAIEIVGDSPQRRARGRADYVLRLKVGDDTHPMAVALLPIRRGASLAAWPSRAAAPRSPG